MLKYSNLKRELHNNSVQRQACGQGFVKGLNRQLNRGQDATSGRFGQDMQSENIRIELIQSDKRSKGRSTRPERPSKSHALYRYILKVYSRIHYD